MGCDIHLYLEYKNPDNTYSTKWTNFGNRYSMGRDYQLFGYLAGVRGNGPPIVAPRGYPTDADYDTDQEFYYFIGDKEDDDGWGRRTVTLETANGWGTQIIYDENNKPQKVADPDSHTPSWLTFSEFTSALVLAETNHRTWIYNDDVETSRNIKDLYIKGLKTYLIKYKALAATMETFEKAGYQTRIVFWFDN